MTPGRLRAVRWTAASIVFQGALHALNPVQRVSKQIAEPMLLHRTEPNAGSRRQAGAASCSNRWACPATGPTPTRTSCRAASASGC